MSFWPFRRKKATERKVVPFPNNFENSDVLKYHGIRALCGALMDRHTSCLSPHPFCGHSGHRQDGDSPYQLIANVIPQIDDTKEFILAIYFCKAQRGLDHESEGLADPLEYAALMTYAEPMPSRKLVAWLLDDGSYVGKFGKITNPVKGDYSTGRLDPDDSRTLNCNPQPKHARWQYWTNNLGDSSRIVTVPEFHCLQVSGEWWIVDVDRVRGVSRQVAGLQFVDSPEHNWGIHHPDRTEKDIYYNPEDGSEWSKVLNENLPKIYP